MSCEEKWKGYENETWKKQSEAESCRKERGLLMGKRCAVKKRFIDGGTARRWRRETHTKKKGCADRERDVYLGKVLRR